jgi:MFS family permease
MRGYRDILASPVGRFIAVSGLARLTWGIEALAVIVHVENTADSFAAAGLAVGALGVTSAVLAPVRGRIIDRRGRGALVAMTVAVTVAIAAIALTPAAGPGALSYVLLAGLAGVVAPPFSAWTRSGLAHHPPGTPASARVHGRQSVREIGVSGSGSAAPERLPPARSPSPRAGRCR